MIKHLCIDAFAENATNSCIILPSAGTTHPSKASAEQGLHAAGPDLPPQSPSNCSDDQAVKFLSLAPSLPLEPQASTTLSDEARTLLAHRIGRWVTLALAGHRGVESGRSKNKLGSRLWLVFKDFEGTVFNPVRVFDAWNKAKPLVKWEDELGDSLCIGMPTMWEAKITSKDFWASPRRNSTSLRGNE